MRNILLVAVLATACATADDDLTEDVTTLAADDVGEGTRVQADPVNAANEVQHILLTGKTADGRVVTFAAARRERAWVHAMLSIGNESRIFDGTGGLVLEGLTPSHHGVGWAQVELLGDTRAVFGLAVHTVDGAFGPRLFVEGTGTVNDEDLEVTGVVVTLPDHADAMLAASPASSPGATDAFALVSVAGETEVVMAAGVVGGELAPSFAIDRVISADTVDAAAGWRRELIVAKVNDVTLAGAHHYLPEHAE